MVPQKRQRVLFTIDQLARAIRRHKLPVEVAAAGSGHQSVTIKTVAEISRKGHHIMNIANVFGSGLIVH